MVEEKEKLASWAMPAEWETHRRTWVAWPHNTETWPRHLAEAQAEFIALVGAIADDEAVVVVAPNRSQADWFWKTWAASMPSSLPVSVTEMPTNDAWIRDYGPTFVKKDGQLAAIDFSYNGWGEKYPPFVDDQNFVRRLSERVGGLTKFGPPWQHVASKLCIEGGAIETDGRGHVMCTRSCAANVNRNKNWNLNDIENELRRCLGAPKVIWLSGAELVGDDTDGHIDQLARFAPGNKILFAWTSDRNDQHYQGLDQMRRELNAFAECSDVEWQLIALPLPPPVRYQGFQIPASYCNFYITNGSVIVPQFGDANSDAQAIEIIGGAFPGRKIVGSGSLFLSTGLGSFHCLTQQQPI